MTRFVARLIALFRRRRLDTELADELSAHLDFAVAENLARGLSPDDARRAAALRFGGALQTAEAYRDRQRFPLLDGLAQDVRYAARSLCASPAFTAVVVLTLAIGIGATTAIFSTVNAALLRPLPFPHPEQLISVRSRLVSGQVTSGGISPAQITSINELPFSGVRLAGVSLNPLDGTWIRPDGTPVDVLLSGVTEEFFPVIGIPLALGPGFTHRDFLPSGENAPTALVLSDRLWTEMFGRDPAVIGRTLHIADVGDSSTIVGVAAPGVDIPRGTDFWFANRVSPRSASHAFAGILRLPPDTRLERLEHAADNALAELARTTPSDVGRAYVMQPLLASIVGDLGSTLLIVLGATALLLLLACVNVTDLLLARGAGRRREFAMRAALGASRGRLVRQMLTEALVLAGAGAVCGLGVAYASAHLLLSLGASKLPRLTAVPFDARVLLFALAVLIFSALAMGTAPAWRLTGADTRALLNESSQGGTPGRLARRSMSTLIVAEIALAIVLTAGVGWSVQSFMRLGAVDPGFAASGRLVVDVKSGQPFRGRALAQAWSDAVLERVRRVPGVRLAGAAATFPLRADLDSTTFVAVQGETPDPNDTAGAHVRAVTPGFFQAMGMPLLAGRDFAPADRSDTTPLVIVNQAFVRRFLGTRNPLTTPFALGFPRLDPAHPRAIIGVVQDVKYKSLHDGPEPAIYVDDFLLRPAIVVTARSGDPQALVSGIRSELRAFDPRSLVTFSAATEIVGNTLGQQRLGMTLMLIFGGIALVLAAIGIYGVIAYAAAQRSGELATRIALGASTRQLFWLMMGGGQRLAAAGLILGTAAAYAGGRVIASRIFAMRAADPIVLIASGVIVAAVTGVAIIIPAIGASRLDPASALRSE